MGALAGVGTPSPSPSPSVDLGRIIQSVADEHQSEGLLNLWWGLGVWLIFVGLVAAALWVGLSRTNAEHAHGRDEVDEDAEIMRAGG